MHLLRTPDGKAHIYYDEPDLSDVSPDTVVAYPTLDVEHEHVELDTTVEEFERAAREDAGLAEDEPLGEVFVEDEPPAGSQAFGAPGKEGKRVGHGNPKRVFAYAPSNPVTELMQELGKNSRQSVSWGEVERIVEMIRGER